MFGQKRSKKLLFLLFSVVFHPYSSMLAEKNKNRKKQNVLNFSWFFEGVYRTYANELKRRVDDFMCTFLPSNKIENDLPKVKT